VATAARLTDWGDPTGGPGSVATRGKRMSKKRSSKFKKHLAALARGESGQALTEYALVLALVSLVGLGLSPIGQLLSTKITEIASAI
jgi:Flp pilus assembly pilin Flp